MTELKFMFMKEQDRVKEQQDGRQLQVTKLKNFKNTGIYEDQEGKKLRNGDNSMVAIFMFMFAQECFPKFNRVVTEHFEALVEVGTCSMMTDFKTNIVRIWQKINEY